MSWSSGRSSGEISKSYCPSTRFDIHPSSAPTSAPANARAAGASGPVNFWPKRSVIGRKRRWNDATLAATQSWRVATRARAGPASDRRPVACATSSSASAVNSSKSGWSECAWYEVANSSLPASFPATRTAIDQSTGSSKAKFFRASLLTSPVTSFCEATASMRFWTPVMCAPASAAMALVGQDLHVVADKRGDGAADGQQYEKPCKPVVPDSCGKNHGA